MAERDMPHQLVELMTTALTGGNIDEVSLVFEGLGSDFYAPIGWFLYLTKVSPEYLPGAGDSRATASDVPPTLLVSASVNAPEPTAYLGRDSATGAARYWDAAAIAAWIAAPRDADVAGAPVPELPERVDMALAAAGLGWCVSRQIRRYGHHVASSSPYLEIPAAVSYRFEAHNYSYNDVTSADHRDTGADLSLSLAVGTEEGSGTWNYALRNARRVEPADIMAAVAAAPPWHTPVAKFDEVAEQWVL